jgi:hypothetical protein
MRMYLAVDVLQDTFGILASMKVFVKISISCVISKTLKYKSFVSIIDLSYL